MSKKNTLLTTTPGEAGGFPAWVTQMREVCQQAISPDDLKAIVEHQVAAAKKGDPAALKFVFEQVLGTASLKGATFVQNVYEAPPAAVPAEPAEVTLTLASRLRVYLECHGPATVSEAARNLRVSIDDVEATARGRGFRLAGNRVSLST